ncbi:glycosyltransferase [bacterium M00.F.Ca.ET.228.01.1.1]|uniref:glycosyltransferase family 2 protein n=1 Tax=Paraburkholderia phenoliruptrix TaxID=252970 RepID=UPI001091A7C2|nr:glycosyltransferase [Paraburkholderia phenoliruptrix]MBW9132065.1 glycosyltransferase [Paraburkholderia ginsengiterrae]TGP42720.1 glycosyltransferase [bacterium M00.F.Ca.ET.228.01.1.1]TGR98910.1 glycosyltransferase [bacterium M00.F.Ca.ET.191.01.1.1]TGU03224.1 glycosyltransferase [bacterium M00.F.Ca.ET.155.01.1.1]MBW0447370.1 glycosyltransferase [Paraburkholderia phenoliruptrix]
MTSTAWRPGNAHREDSVTESNGLNAQLISICIPTCNRPHLIEEAMRSCEAQTYGELEIVIGDDSSDERTEQVVKRCRVGAKHPVRYERNLPRLGQASNVNRLFARARGARLVLLHDDDLLEPHALATLAACWQAHPDLTAAFGKQRVIADDGTPRADATARLNRDYRRVPERAGRLAVPALAGIDQMFPNNGYLVDTLAARRIGYRLAAQVGEACDFDFGLRLCVAAAGVCFVDEFVSVSRETALSISTHALPAMHAFAQLCESDVPAAARAARDDALRRVAPRAASAYARAGEARAAWRVLLSKHYALRDRLRARFLYHVLLATRSTLAPRTPPGG